jgi:hypothetical protein
VTGDDMAHIRDSYMPSCSCSGGYSNHELGFQEAPQAGPTRVEAIQTGCQCDRQVWPILHEHANPQATGRPAVPRLVAFPITVPADKKPTVTRKEPRGLSPGCCHSRTTRFALQCSRDVDALRTSETCPG